VPTDTKIVDERVKELGGPKVISDLTDTQRRHLQLVRFLTDNCRVCVWEGKKPKIMAATIAGDPRLGTIVTGLCSYDDATLYLSPSALNTEEGTIATFYHEMGHWVGGQDAVDGSIPHTKAVQDVAGHISLLILQKTADIKRILSVEKVEGVELVVRTPIGVGAVQGGPPVKAPFKDKVMEYEYKYTLNDVKRLAREHNLSTSGDKKEIIRRLIEVGVE
jgi:hypothetical protein